MLKWISTFWRKGSTASAADSRRCVHGGDPSAGGRKVAIPPECTSELWSAYPLWIDRDIDVVAFFAQDTLPYVWPDGQEYVASVSEHSTPQEYLRFQWLWVFLHHPRLSVVNDVLEKVPLQSHMYLAIRLGQLLGWDSRTSQNAATALWKYCDAWLKNVVISLHRRYPESSRSVDVLWRTCPSHKRPDLKALLDEYF